MEDNGMVSVAHKLTLGNSESVEEILKKHGPFMIIGPYDITRVGHALLVVGVNHRTQRVAIQDPASLVEQAQWQPMQYLERTFRTPGSDNIDTYAVIALEPVIDSESGKPSK